MNRPASSTSRRALAVREILLIVAALTIGFGLIVSLARRVRSEAAYTLVQRELLELHDALQAYRRTYGQLPEVEPLLPEPGPLPLERHRQFEPLLRERALVQNRQIVHALGVGARQDEASRSPLGGVSAMMFDGSTLLDPWGRPIAYLPSGRPEIGTAAGDAPFFFSAGPDGLFLTREDNFYSYEVLAGGPADEREPDPPPAPELLD